jgi:uncharacterized membrane protein (UPF0182 family)
VTFPSAPSMPHLHIGFRPKGWVVGLVLAIAVIVILLATVGTSIWVDLLFYREVHFTKVFTTVLTTRIVLFFLVGVVGAAVITTNLVLGYVLRPAYVPMSPEQQQLEGYRVTLSPLRKPLTAVVALILGVLFGVAGQHDWRVVLLRLHGKSFGQKDPLFHRDLSYYAFDLPFERTVVSFGFTMLVLALVAAALTHYFYGGIRLQTRGEKVSAAARAHLSVLVGLFLVLKAIAYYLDRYGLTLSSQGGTGTTGAGYTDVHATLPAKTILIFIALICAGLFFANAVRRGAVLAAAGLGTMVFAALVVGGLVPFLVQQFHVKPNAINLEAKYINSSIDATRQAYRRDDDVQRAVGAGGIRGDRHDQQRGECPAAGPQRAAGDLRAAAADPVLLLLPPGAGRGPVHDRRPGAVLCRGHPRREPRGPAGRPAQLGQRAPRLHARPGLRGG